MHYYTYAYLREDKTPYYIGKGKGNRAFLTKRVGAKPPKDKSRIIYLKQNLTEEEAFKHEVYMIFVLGRKDLGTGILHNRTDGGEGSSGWVPSEETKRKLSKANKGKTRSEETKKNISVSKKNLSEETKRKLSEANKGNTNMLGKTHSEETKIKIGSANKGRTHSEETKRKMSEVHKNITEKTRRKMSEAHKNPSEETRRKIGDANKGKKWWNDGCGNCKMMVQCPGDDWKLGMK